MGDVNIKYCFKLDGRETEIFDLMLDEKSMEPVEKISSQPAAWTRLGEHQCSHCPLDAGTHPDCPVALSVSSVIERFNNVTSHDEVDLEVITCDRSISQHTTAQRAISSLLGLLIATSGCPYTEYFKPMARFHLPLATEEETIFRAAGSYLVAQYLLRKNGGKSDFELTGLKKIYDDLHIVNTMIAERVRSATRADSSVNAVILLDMFTNLMPYVIEDHLDDIRHLFNSYL